jgi:hypothetical protein
MPVFIIVDRSVKNKVYGLFHSRKSMISKRWYTLSADTILHVNNGKLLRVLLLLLVSINVSSKQDYYMEVKHGLYQDSY